MSSGTPRPAPNPVPRATADGLEDDSCAVICKDDVGDELLVLRDVVLVLSVVDVPEAVIVDEDNSDDDEAITCATDTFPLCQL
jgi:hypothetical protein